MIDRISHFLSSSERQKRWKRTREKGFIWFFVTDAVLLIPTVAIVAVGLYYLIFIGRSPQLSNYLFTYFSALCYSIPWAFLTWRNAERHYNWR